MIKQTYFTVIFALTLPTALRAQPTIQNIDELLNGIATLDLTNAGKPSNEADAIRLGRGIFTSFCPILACVYTPRGSTVSTPSFYDHQRASVLFQAKTRDDGHSEEQNLAVITTIGTGFAKPYSANTEYAAGDNTVVGNAVYRAVSSGKTGADTRPPGVRPTEAQGGNYVLTDGSVRWKWINDAAIDAKVGAYIETNVVPGAGAAWGAAFNYHFDARPEPGHYFPGVEMDYSNESGLACNLGVTDCTALVLALGGSQVTQGLQVTGNNRGTYSSLWGIRLNGDKLASQSAIEVDAAVPVGLSFGGSGLGGQSHSIASIQDFTVSPASLSILGSHSTAAILDRSQSQIGLALRGSYPRAQIEGRNFAVYPDGSQRIGAALTISPEEEYRAMVGYDVSKDRTFVQSTHSTVPTSLTLNPSGGLVQAGPGGFSETLSTPTSSSAPCIKGQFTDDANYHYVCVQTNMWKRVALSSF